MSFLPRTAFAAAIALGCAAPALAKDTPAAKPATLAEVDQLAGKKIEKGHTVVLTTSAGTIEMVLFPKAAPKTVANFEKLVKSGF